MAENVNRCSSRQNNNTKKDASQIPQPTSQEQHTAGVAFISMVTKTSRSLHQSSPRLFGQIYTWSPSSLNIHCPLKQSESRRTIMAVRGCKSHHDTISYEDMMEVIEEFSAILIDVREREEIAETGSIPNSINIPLGELEEALVNTPDDKFKEKYGIDKPVKYHSLVFFCHSGKRSLTASLKAYALGYFKYV
uniref:(California timema) hypothetical protein n=1 Tax=Timema californicum TaxID=61474 RepID=A0A7R9P9K8_TIMCA|nr:unnamed protein product [Timema californicum]